MKRRKIEIAHGFQQTMSQGYTLTRSSDTRGRSFDEFFHFGIHDNVFLTLGSTDPVRRNDFSRHIHEQSTLIP